jgi:hypothetical protein
MLNIILILILPLIILLISLVFIRRMKQRFNARLRRIRHRINNRSLTTEFDQNFLEEEVYLPYIGDPTCDYNAHSPYLRCTVNPHGPCETCHHYQPKSNYRQGKTKP